jgi:hypothetical protein
MNHKLTEKYIINLMKEEWDKKVQSFVEKSKKSNEKDISVDFDVDGDGHTETVISPGLKVTNKNDDPMSGLEYTVVALNAKTVTLSRPDVNGSKTKAFTITREDFETNYKL